MGSRNSVLSKLSPCPLSNLRNVRAAFYRLLCPCLVAKALVACFLQRHQCHLVPMSHVEFKKNGCVDFRDLILYMIELCNQACVSFGTVPLFRFIFFRLRLIKLTTRVL